VMWGPDLSGPELSSSAQRALVLATPLVQMLGGV
jgi:hypothetical protein